MTIQEAKKLIRKAHFSADKPLDSLDLAVEKIYAELFGITEQMEELSKDVEGLKVAFAEWRQENAK